MKRNVEKIIKMRAELDLILNDCDLKLLSSEDIVSRAREIENLMMRT